MKLYDKNCLNAKPRKKTYKLFDGQGLYLEVTPTGSKLWRLKYHYSRKEKSLSLGPYPRVTLAEAREKRLEAKKLLDADIAPSAAKRERRRKAILDAENSFKAVALEWHENQKERWSEDYAAGILHRLETDIFPSLGSTRSRFPNCWRHCARSKNAALWNLPQEHGTSVVRFSAMASRPADARRISPNI